MAETPFLGGSYVSPVPQFAFAQLVNLYPKFNETRSGATPGGLFTCPGLDTLATIGSGPIRAMTQLAGQPTLLVLSGASVHQVSLPSFTDLGSIGNIGTSSGVAYMTNTSLQTSQVGIFDGVSGWSVIGGVLAPISLPFPNPGRPVFQDGFVLLPQTQFNQVWQSNLNDLTTWNPLNFVTDESKADNVVSLGQQHQMVVVFKDNHTDFYVNAGLPGFVFQQLQGVQLSVGCVASASVANVGEDLCWLGQNQNGDGIVFVMRGYEAEPITTDVLVEHWATFPTIADAFAYGYQASGHDFYVITFPSAAGGSGETWACDLKATRQAKYPVWHQRGPFANGAFSRHQANCFLALDGQLLIGDYASGAIYQYDPTVTTGLGKWMRTWRAFPKNKSPAIRFGTLEIMMQSGIGVPPGLNPQLMLEYSDDSQTWIGPRYTSAGALGNTSARLKFTRLGTQRRGLATDRIFRLSSTDTFGVCLLGAEVFVG